MSALILQVRKVGFVGLLVAFVVWMMFSPVQAQEGRPTPTVDPGIEETATPRNTPIPIDPTATPETPEPSPTPGEAGADNAQRRGAIQGMVFEDVDGDGRCINTGISGEGPVAGVDVEFVSSDEQTVITLQSGPDGRYGLAAAGYSNWAVTAKPGADWVVTSDETIYAPVYEDSLVVTDVNFCVQQADSVTVMLPASGGGLGSFGTLLLLAVGLLFLALGIGLYWRSVHLAHDA